jgi:hypothetical protein
LQYRTVNLVLVACHAVTGTIAYSLTWVIVPNGETIACLCAFKRERYFSAVCSGCYTVRCRCGDDNRGKHWRVYCAVSIVWVLNHNTHERGQSVICNITLSTFTIKSKATPITALAVINRSEQSAVLVTTIHTLPAVSWLRWWLCPALLSM